MGFRSPKYFIQFLYFAVLTIVTVHIVMECGLSYVNRNGCYRVHLKDSGNITGEYKSMYDAYQLDCPIVYDQNGIVV